MKSGVRTSEFWIALVLIACEAALALAEVLPAEWAATLAAVTAIAYKVLRTLLKFRAMEIDADTLLAQLDGRATVSSPAVPFEKLTFEEQAARVEAQRRGESGHATPGLVALLAIGAALVLVLLPGCAGLPPRTYSFSLSDGAGSVAASITLGAAGGLAK